MRVYILSGNANSKVLKCTADRRGGDPCGLPRGESPLFFFLISPGSLENHDQQIEYMWLFDQNE